MDSHVCSFLRNTWVGWAGVGPVGGRCIFNNPDISYFFKPLENRYEKWFLWGSYGTSNSFWMGLTTEGPKDTRGLSVPFFFASFLAVADPSAAP